MSIYECLLVAMAVVGILDILEGELHQCGVWDGHIGPRRGVDMLLVRHGTKSRANSGEQVERRARSDAKSVPRRKRGAHVCVCACLARLGAFKTFVGLCVRAQPFLSRSPLHINVQAQPKGPGTCPYLSLLHWRLAHPPFWSEPWPTWFEPPILDF